MSTAPDHILIAGGGVAGWMSALALARALSPLGTQVSVVDSGGPDESLGRHGPALSTLPSVTDHHGWLDLDNLNIVRAGRGSFKLGEAFDGWVSGDATLLPYGQTGADIGPVRFHQQLLRLGQRADCLHLADYSLAGMAARLGRFAPPSDDPASFLSTLDFGLHLEVAGYGQFLRTKAMEAGAREIPGTVVSATQDQSGRLTAALLEDGRSIDAQFFFDATGPRASLVAGVLGVPWQSWPSGFDRIASAIVEDNTPAMPVTRCEALSAGWKRTVPLYGARAVQLIYASGILDDETAIRHLGGNATIGVFNPGRRTAPWRQNCLAVGAAACVCDPLASAEQHLAASAVERFVRLLPHNDGGGVEAREYNRVFSAETDSARDFAALRYLTNTRDEAVWVAARNIPPSPDLARQLALFTARGRIPRSEDGIFDESMWAAAFAAQRVQPRDHDPLANGLDRDALKQRCEFIRKLAADTARSLPDHGTVLAQIHGNQP